MEIAAEYSHLNGKVFAAPTTLTSGESWRA